MCVFFFSAKKVTALRVEGDLFDGRNILDLGQLAKVFPNLQVLFVDFFLFWFCAFSTSSLKQSLDVAFVALNNVGEFAQVSSPMLSLKTLNLVCQNRYGCPVTGSEINRALP